VQYVGSDQKTVSVADAARLMGVTDRWVRMSIESGKIVAVAAPALLGGGANGTTYRIPVDSLPPQAQIAYWQQSAVAELGHGGKEFDYVGYLHRNGEEAIQELRRRQKAALAAHGLRRDHEENGRKGYTDALDALARELGIPQMTLWRWERAYSENGLAGLARKAREDAGQSRSACLLSRDYLEFLMCSEHKLTQAYALEKLQKLAKNLGETACANCPYRHASEARNQEVASGHQLPACDQVGYGLIAPENRYAVNRIMQHVDASALAYARYGSRYWDAKFLQKAVREKPELINEIWFGDHHMLNLFVVDAEGRVFRPWLTAWMDAASSTLVGWMLTTNPNSDTIAESFARGAVATKGSPFRGLPRIVYIDNGKDYRSKRFEGSQLVEYDIGRLNDDFAGRPMLEALGVGVKHAIPYWAWSKPIERMFGTLDRRWMRDMPGWCGDAPEQRPQEIGKLITFEAFAARFKAEVIDNYHIFRGEDGLTPMERYQRGTRARTDDPDWATMAMLRSQSTRRTVTTQGVRLDGVRYQDRALAGYVGKEVTVLHQRGGNLSVTILHNSRFVCEAERVDAIRMIETDTARLDQLMADKAAQRKGVKAHLKQIQQRVGGIEREAYVEEIDEAGDRALAKFGSVDAQRVMAAKGETVKKAKRRAGQRDEADRRVDEHLVAMGRAMMRGTREG
jgi:putative transposase